MGSLLQERCSILHKTAVTKQWTAKWFTLPLLFHELYEIMVNIVTFVGFGEAIIPIPPQDPALRGQAWFQESSSFENCGKTCSFCRQALNYSYILFRCFAAFHDWRAIMATCVSCTPALRTSTLYDTKIPAVLYSVCTPARNAVDLRTHGNSKKQTIT